MSENFNPNVNFNPKAKKIDVWGTYIPGRKPKFKLHYTRGHAINALKYRSKRKNQERIIPECCTLWKKSGEQWVEIMFNHTYTDALEIYNG